jgi:hypothetical protein
MFTIMRTIAIISVALLSGVSAFAQGNGFPSGTHYDLNIQGKTTCAGSGLTGSNRHTIQVLLNVSGQKSLIDKTNEIFLQPGPEFQVLDGNACDPGGALFQLPSNVATAWTAWARALSKPNTSMDITSCLVDTTNTVICSTGNPLDLVRNSGKPVTLNATSQLLFVCEGGIGPNCTGGTSVPIFSNPLFMFFWNVDNFGLRNAQIRFYPD